MKSIILRTMTTYLLPLMLIFSIFILFRGHYQPGGGFVGGLIASSAFSLYLIAFGLEKVRMLLYFEPIKIIATGLLLAIVSALIPLFLSNPLMTGTWLDLSLPVIGKLGTPTIFDIGVYFTVLGVTLNIIFTMAEERE